MATVQETIPEALQPDVDVALAWFNSQQEVEFEVTGILDPDEALAGSGTRELRLVLCGGDRCEQHSFRVAANGGGHEVAFAGESSDATSDTDSPQAELDPPPGARRDWLDGALARHSFVVLLYYRGFW